MTGKNLVQLKKKFTQASFVQFESNSKIHYFWKYVVEKVVK